MMVNSMKKMQCEVCGGNEIKKISATIFECQSCGVQYSTEEVKKLFLEITGEVKIDRSADAENMVKRAKQFEKRGNKEKANEYHVIAAVSLLGTLLAQPKSYPVGMVNLLDITPLTFDEFLDATDKSLFEFYQSITKEQQIEEIFHNRLMEAYNNYLIIGGMPECVSSWIKYKDPTKISQIQIYENDFSKHNGKVNSGRILMVFRSIVTQLAKSNEKFMYGAVREGAIARDFEEAIEWLVSAGMLNRVYNISKLEHPLSAFEKLDQFKLFVFDTGLLKHMAGIDNSAILLKADYQFKGPLTENYVLSNFADSMMLHPIITRSEAVKLIS